MAEEKVNLTPQVDLKDAYVIGEYNFAAWSKGKDENENPIDKSNY